MKLKINNKFSRWLYKVACKFGYNPLPIKPIYITPRNLIRLHQVIKVPQDVYDKYTKDITESINKEICYGFVKEEAFRQNIKVTRQVNYVDNTIITYAELYILNKEGLEGFYERY